MPSLRKKPAKRPSAHKPSAAPVPKLQPPTVAVQERNGELTWSFPQPLAWCRAMVSRMRLAEQEVGFALCTLIGRGVLRVKDRDLVTCLNDCAMGEQDFTRLIHLAPQKQRSAILYPIKPGNADEHVLDWFAAVLQRKVAADLDAKCALQHLYLNHLHFEGTHEVELPAPLRWAKDKWWNTHGETALTKAFGLQQWEARRLFGEELFNVPSPYEAGKAPWTAPNPVTESDQCLVRLETVLRRAIRSDADVGEAMFNYEQSQSPMPPDGVYFYNLASQRFGMHSLEAVHLHGLGEKLSAESKQDLSHWSNAVPKIATFGLLSRFHEACIAQFPMSVPKHYNAVFDLFRSASEHPLNITFMTLLAHHFGFGRTEACRLVLAVCCHPTRHWTQMPQLEDDTLVGIASPIQSASCSTPAEFPVGISPHLLDFWLCSGDPKEAMASLDLIPLPHRAHPRVLVQKFYPQMALQQWKEAFATAQALIRLQPGCPEHLVKLAQAMHRLRGGGLRNAYMFLYDIVRHCKGVGESVFAYQLARFACQMKQLDLADWWLDRAFALDPDESLKRTALGELDLKPLWPATEAKLRASQGGG